MTVLQSEFEAWINSRTVKELKDLTEKYFPEEKTWFDLTENQLKLIYVNEKGKTFLNDYYSKQLEKINLTNNGVHNPSFKIKGLESETNWLTLNEHSAISLCDWLKKNFDIK